MRIRHFCHFTRISANIPITLSEILKIRIDSLRSCGNGISTSIDNCVIQVSGVLPGELVEVKIRKWNKGENFFEADLVSVIEPSTFRIQPSCKYFGECSGCQLQHADITFQRDWKRTVVQNYLCDSGMSFASVNQVLGNDKVYGYRSKITPTYTFSNGVRPASIGFFNNKTRRPIDITECMVASDLINRRYAQYRMELIDECYERDLKRRKNQMRPLLLRESDNPEKYVETDQKTVINQSVLGYVFQFCANDFFQINSSLLPMFFQYIVNQALKNTKKMNYVIDTYCGCGVFSILLSPYFQHVVGIDISYQSIQSANHNKTLNAITNITFQHGEANEIFSSVSQFPSDETVVIMDPSRKGSDKLFLRQLFQFSPAKIVYVACNVQTQIRDCQLIVENGYEIIDCQPFDMFPQTSHIENVITLEKKK